MRWVVGLLLVCAAALKAAQLLYEPATTLVSPFGWLLLPVEIGIEFAIGIVVLTGVYWRVMRRLAAVLFAAFALYSLYLAVSGATSCGCFGQLRVHPWWIFLLDVAVVIGLLISIARDQVNDHATSGPKDALHGFFSAHRRKLVAFAIANFAVTALLLTRQVDRRMAMAGSQLTKVGDLVLLEPEQWIGQKLPIAEFINADLSLGEWIAVLHRHDCPACQEAVLRYEQLASTGHQVALIEVPPYGRGHSTERFCRNCRLKDDREWFVQTPVEIRLHDGVVTAVQGDVH